VATIPYGLRLWHGQGKNFGFGLAKGEVCGKMAITALIAAVVTLSIGIFVDGE
jgi:hypothetical protein